VTPDGEFLVVGGGDGDRSIHLFTDNAALIESRDPTEAVIDDTKPPNSTTSDALPSAPDDSADPAVEVNARAEEVPITSQVLGWVENIISLLFEPQKDFLA